MKKASEGATSTGLETITVSAILAHQGQHVKGARPKSVDSIDHEPLTGRARNEFEASLFKRVKRSAQLVLRVILDHAAGKAEAWPSNKRIAELAGFHARNVQLILRGLEAAELIRCIPDRSLKTQRRIVILEHPNAVRILNRFRAYSWMNSGAQARTEKPAPTVHPGAQKPVHPGTQASVGAGAQVTSSESCISPSGELEAKNFLVLSTGAEKTDQAVGTWFKPRRPPSAPARRFRPDELARELKALAVRMEAER